MRGNSALAKGCRMSQLPARYVRDLGIPILTLLIMRREALRWRNNRTVPPPLPIAQRRELEAWPLFAEPPVLPPHSKFNLTYRDVPWDAHRDTRIFAVSGNTRLSEYPYPPPDMKRQQPWMTRNCRLPTRRWMIQNVRKILTPTSIARRYSILRASRRTDYSESDRHLLTLKEGRKFPSEHPHPLDGMTASNR
jgi:hypothetical protein